MSGVFAGQIYHQHAWWTAAPQPTRRVDMTEKRRAVFLLCSDASGIDREPAAQSVHLRPDLIGVGGEILGRHAQQLGDLHHLRLLEAAGGDGRGAHSDAAGDKGLFRVIGNGVFINGDLYLIQAALKFLTGDFEIPDVHQHQMVIRAARDQAETLLGQLLRENLCIFHHLLPIRFELWL